MFARGLGPGEVDAINGPTSAGAQEAGRRFPRPKPDSPRVRASWTSPVHGIFAARAPAAPKAAAQGGETTAVCLSLLPREDQVPRLLTDDERQKGGARAVASWRQVTLTGRRASPENGQMGDRSRLALTSRRPMGALG